MDPKYFVFLNKNNWLPYWDPLNNAIGPVDLTNPPLNPVTQEPYWNDIN